MSRNLFGNGTYLMSSFLLVISFVDKKSFAIASFVLLVLLGKTMIVIVMRMEVKSWSIFMDYFRNVPRG